MSRITSKDHTVQDLFRGDDHFYRIPSYQRAYEWKRQQVEELFDDLIEHHQEWRDGNQQPEYLLGQVIVHDGVDALEISDGQQRMTTLYLLLGALRARAEALASEDRELGARARGIETMLVDVTYASSGVESRPRLTDQKSSGTAVLLRVAEGGDLAGEEFASVEIRTLKEAHALLAEKVSTLAAGDLKSFLHCLLVSVKLVVTRCASASTGVRTFIKLNDRGLAPDLADLLKASLYEGVSRSEREALLELWNTAVTTVRTSPRPRLSDFLAYYAFSDHLSSRRATKDVLNALRSGGHLRDPMAFARGAVSAASTYARLLGGRDPSGLVCVPLKNASSVKRLARFRQHIPVLMAGRTLSAKRFRALADEIESLLFVFSVIGEAPPLLERITDDLVPLLKEHLRTGDDALWDELLERVQKERVDRSAAFRNSFLSLTTENFDDNAVRYLLGRCEQHLKGVENGGRQGVVVASEDALTAVAELDVEHILPKSRNTGADAEFGPGAPLCFSHIGNLTPLEGSINRSLQDKAYSEKIKEYRASNVRLTRSMAESMGVGTNTGRSRMEELLERFPAWSQDQVARRAEMLYKIACRAWAVPEHPGAPVSFGSTGPQVGPVVAPRRMPQAKVSRVLDVLAVLSEGPTHESRIAERLGVARGDYHADAAAISGMAEEIEDRVWTLSAAGAALLARPEEAHERGLADALEQLPIIQQYRVATPEERVAMVRAAGYSGDTVKRRLQEVAGWSSWSAAHRS